MSTELYQAAKEYAARGWSIIPLCPNKMPALKKWKPYQKERPTDADLRRWFIDGQGIIGEVVGLGVVCGAVSGGPVVRDFDTMEGYERFAKKRPDLARTLPTVETKRGRHVYFANGLRRIVEFADGELRGAGYVCLPPTLHPSGKVYRWVNPLPTGPLVTVADPAAAGLAGDNGSLAVLLVNKQRPRKQIVSMADGIKELAAGLDIPMLQRGQRVTENTERTEITEEINSVLSVLSVTKEPKAKTPKNEIDHAINQTLPTSPGIRHRQVFKFCRALKRISAVADLPLPSLKPLVKRWHDAALPFIDTKDFDTTWTDFVNGFPLVRFALGESTMDTIMERLETMPPPPETGNYDTPAVKLLVALCAALQQQAGAEPFYLDVRTAARLLGVNDAMTAWRWMKMLKADGLLVEVEKGKTGRATRWRWIGGNGEGGAA